MTNETAPKQPTFREELTKLINKHGIDSMLELPDHVVSNFLYMCFSGLHRVKEETLMHRALGSTRTDERF